MDPDIQSNMRIIDKVQQKIKEFMDYAHFDDIMWFSIIFFVALGSFALGRIAERSYIRENTPIKIEYTDETVELWNEYQLLKETNTKYFASKSGEVVYPLNCSKGERIKEENRIFFVNLQQALDLGYREVEGC
ncbi:MAG: hypothetical protein MRY57_02525 [Candidatus Pacebacteria bacterium]|nr:hypothetical protein [Candidatus Paceibacterota bacterium]